MAAEKKKGYNLMEEAFGANPFSAAGTKEATEERKKNNAQRHYSGVIAAPLWEDFVAINRARGMSNNSSLNQLITGYIRDNREYLEG